MVTLKDIAQQTGVSVRTVSRALYDSGYVRQDRKEHILKVAAEQGYRPDRKARGLRTGISHEITAVINNVGELTAAKIAACEAVLRRQGYLLNILFMSDPDPKRGVTDIISEVKNRRPAGLLLFNRPDNLLKGLDGNPLPTVAIDMDSDDYACDTVSIDRQQGVYEAVQYLSRQGRRRIGYIGHHADTRLAGYRRALEENGLAPILFEEPLHRAQFEAGRNAAAAWLEMDLRPDAVQAYTDETALGFLAGLSSHGISVPEDVAVIGFDNRRASQLAAPPLTTVGQPNIEVGETAARMLLERIESRTASPAVRRSLLPTRLIIRETT